MNLNALCIGGTLIFQLPRKIHLIMKITTFLLLITVMTVSATSFAQRITLNEKNATLQSVLKAIHDQSGYDFFYNDDLLRNAQPVNVQVREVSLEQALQAVLSGQPMSYEIDDKAILIKEKEKSSSVKPELKSELAQVLFNGKVTDEKGIPLQGVTITVKGGQTLAVTNKDGMFTILLDKNAIVSFSYVGFQSKELAVADVKSPVTIVLKEAVNSLDDVEVLAYGTTTHRLTTANVTTITAKEIGTNPVTNVLQALENRVPGLYIQQNTGVVGGSFTTTIRNGSSINGSPPLFIIDGVQYPAGTPLPMLGGLQPGTQNQYRGGNALNYLNPDDIESVSVLKDADATAIYGSRGAYGVMLITTKKAKPGDARLVANVYNGIEIRGVVPPLLNTDQYLMIRREALKNDGLTPGAGDLDLNGTWSTNSYTDWRKYYLGSVAQNQNADLSYSGGANNTNYLISGNIHNQGMIEKGNGSDIEGSMRMDLNNTSKNGKLFVDLTATYNLSRNNEVPADFTSNIIAAPNAPLPVLPNGALDWSQGTNSAAALNAQYLNTTQNLLAALTIRYNLTKHLTLNSQIAFNSLEGKEFRALPTSYFIPTANVNTKTTSSISTFRDRSLSFDPNIQYQDLFFKKLKMDSRVGVTLQDAANWQIQLTGTNFPSDVLLSSPTSASNPVQSSYSSTPNRYIGAFITSALNWDNKYLLSLNGRRDGSTKFGPGNRFGNFGSVAGGWIVSEEPWMKAIRPVMDFLKIRGSYGTVGGDQIQANSYLNTYSVTSSPYSGSTGLLPNVLANPTLHWESKKTEDLGITMTFLKGRIELDVDYYRSWTSNSLISQPEPLITGFANITVNAPNAKLLTYGYEASLTLTNVKTKNFKWTTNLNFTLPHSKLLSFPGFTDANSYNTQYPNLVLGKPVTGTRLYNYAGVDPQTGFYQFKSAAGVVSDYNILTGAGILALTDATQFVDLAPKYYGGIGNNFTYKRLNLDIFMQLTRKNAMNFYGQQAAVGSWPGEFNVNMTTAMLGRWQKPGDITNVPAPTTSYINGYFPAQVFASSTGAFSDITYLRINNLNIGYDLTSAGLNKAGIKRLNVFLRGQNLWVFSKYKELDPENMSISSIGPLRSFVAGFNVTL